MINGALMGASGDERGRLAVQHAPALNPDSKAALAKLAHSSKRVQM